MAGRLSEAVAERRGDDERRIALADLPPRPAWRFNNFLPLFAGYDRSFPGDAAPTVRLGAPDDGAAVAAGAELRLAADAADADGPVARVVFRDGDAPIGMAQDPPFVVTWRAAVPGLHRLTAVAVDARGRATASAPVAVTVAP